MHQLMGLVSLAGLLLACGVGVEVSTQTQWLCWNRDSASYQAYGGLLPHEHGSVTAPTAASGQEHFCTDQELQENHFTKRPDGTWVAPSPTPTATPKSGRVSPLPNPPFATPRPTPRRTS